MKTAIACTLLVLLALLLAPLISTALSSPEPGGRPQAAYFYPDDPAGPRYLPLVMGQGAPPPVDLPTVTPAFTPRPSPTPIPTPLPTATLAPYP